MFNLAGLFNLFTSDPHSNIDSASTGFLACPLVDDFTGMGHTFDHSAGIDALNNMDMGMSAFDF